MSDQLSLLQIKRAYHQAAKIVARYGDKYLPIFERLEKEYHERKDKIETLKRAIEIAEKHTVFEPQANGFIADRDASLGHLVFKIAVT